MYMEWFNFEFKASEKQALALSYLMDWVTREIGYWWGAGWGKAQTLDSKILTPDWRTTMWDISVWDFIITPNNWWSKVIAEHYWWERDVYEIEFIDWAKTKVSDEHLWDCRLARKKHSRNIRNTKWLIEKFNSKLSRKNILIPLCKPLEFWIRYDKIHPYIVWALIWDWWMTQWTVFTTEDTEIVDFFKEHLTYWQDIEFIKDFSYRIKWSKRWFKWYLYNEFKNETDRLWLRCKCEHKRIPKEIMEWDLWTRIECIKWLMDTDWYIDERWHPSFCSKSRWLVEDLQYLIWSIWWKATLWEHYKSCMYKWEEKWWIYYWLYITTNDNTQLFRLTKKLNRVKNKEFDYARRIKNIRYIWKEEVKCITISDPNWLYITDDFIVTHNSYIGVVWLWMMSNKYPWTRRFIWRKELSNLIKTTLNTYYKFWADYMIPNNLMGKLDKKYNIIKFGNWSEILLLDCATQPADPLFTRFGSLELTWGFIDESNEIDEQAITILKTRISRQKNREYGIIPKLLETFNPDQWHVKRRYWTPYKTGTLPDYRQFIPALVTDNPKIDPEYITQLQNSDEITRQRLLFGNFEWSSDEWKLFRYDEIYDLFRTNIDKKSDIHYITCDVARLGNDKTVIGIRKWLECIKIITYAQNTLDILADKIKQLEEDYWISRRNICIDSDWVGGWLADMLRWCTNFVNGSSPIKLNPEKRWYVLKNYWNLKTQCYFKLKEMMERREIRVYADWEIRDMLSQELENIFIKDVDKDWKIKLEEKADLRKRLNRSPDFADMIMFRMLYLVKEMEQDWSRYEWVTEINYDDVLF